MRNYDRMFDSSGKIALWAIARVTTKEPANLNFLQKALKPLPRRPL